MYWTIFFVLVAADNVAIPRVVDDRIELTLIAREPAIMTPTGVAIDTSGRAFVVECHTHFRPKDYPGPSKDRILLFDKLDEPDSPRKVFFEGTEATMNIGLSPAGDLFIATRQEILCIRKADQLDQASSAEKIARLETKGDYPHNGLSGFAFDNEGHLWVGLGENLGADYTFIASDGSRVRGGGEGGSVYRMNMDGSNLRRIATGFWNPFHLYRDPGGRLFAIDNDPDARPPCRLLHLIDGGDYGFKFRYGRNGLHPFHAWNGELPGTLPMMAGTGEAPSGMVGIEGPGWPNDMLGSLLVTSWGDHRIEQFDPQPWGTSWRATLTPLVIGSDSFRPVGIARGKRGEVFFSDWVDKSYELHQKGRLWRLRVKEDRTAATDAERTAFEKNRPTEAEGPTTVAVAEQSLLSADPFERTRARNYLRDHLPLAERTRRYRETSTAKAEWLLTIRDDDPTDVGGVIALALADPDPLIRLIAVQWVGDKRLKAYREKVEGMLSQPFPWTRSLLESTLASLELLEKNWATADAGSQFITKLLEREDLDPTLYRYALRSLPTSSPWLTGPKLTAFSQSSDHPLAVEAVRTLRESTLAERETILVDIAGDTDLSPEIRAEAILGLQTLPNDNTLGVLLVDLSQEPDMLVQRTALRVIDRGTRLTKGSPRSIDGVMALLNSPGDPIAGERLFFDPSGPGCYRCHQVEGRGANAGPDLSTIARGSDRTRLVGSVVEPSKEIAPMYVPWLVVTTRGESKIGLLVREGLQGEQYYVGSDSQEFMLKPEDIEERRESKESIMPHGLLDQATEIEIRDLMSYLEKLR
ncbi:c-type cytochrome [bacterium]|nr:c-type cytochrome [bacterium]